MCKPSLIIVCLSAACLLSSIDLAQSNEQSMMTEAYKHDSLSGVLLRVTEPTDSSQPYLFDHPWLIATSLDARYVAWWGGYMRDTCLGVNDCTPRTFQPCRGGYQALSATGRYVSCDTQSFSIGFAVIGYADTCEGAHGPCTPDVTNIAVAPDGGKPNGQSFGRTSTSYDGRFVAFYSEANNLVEGDANGVGDVFVRDTCTGAPGNCAPKTTRVSVADDGSEANAWSGGWFDTDISGDGRYVAFMSMATNLIAGEPNPPRLLYLRDTCFGAPRNCRPTTTIVSYQPNGAKIGAGYPVINKDGRYVAFQTSRQVMVRDTCSKAAPHCTASTAVVSIAVDGSEAWGQLPGISPEGRFITFSSFASGAIPGGAFIRDMCFGAPAGCLPRTELVSKNRDGVIGNRGGGTGAPRVSEGGHFVVFSSQSTNFVPNVTYDYRYYDIFVARTPF